MIRRRHLWMAIAIAGATVLLFTFAVGTMVTLGVHTREHEDRDAPDTHSGDARAETDRVPVLCYHYIRGPGNPLRVATVFGYVVLSLPLLDDTELWKVSRGNFERQMEYLARRGYHSVSLDELHEWQMGRRLLPPKSVVITFDDADESVYEYAYPVLEKHGLRATMFVITSRVGTTWNGVRCLDWARLREIQRSGVFGIESHTHDYHYKVGSREDSRPVFVAASEGGPGGRSGTSWEEALFNDLARSRVLIEQQIGRTSRFLAWPYGFGNPAVNRVAMDAGFTRTCGLRARPNRRLDGGGLLITDTERFEIPRYTITARTSLRTFREMLDGTYLPAR
jgi:peptidoglycan/xylan/chitin deacetylase (PgdA/CDA1 family)